MKVLHFSSAKTWRGGEQQIAYLLKELRQLDIQQFVFCVRGSAMADFCLRENFPFEVYKKSASINPFPARGLAKQVDQHDIDLIHIHDAHAHTFACIAASFFGVKTPLILSRRVDFRIKNNFLSHWKYKHSSIKAILCVSKFIKEVLKKDIPASEHIQVVHSGIDLSRFHFEKNNLLKEAFNIPLPSPLIANVAAIAPHKDYFTFVDTAALLLQKRPDVRFLIIGGDGGKETEIRQYIRKKSLESYIQLTGFRNDIPEVLPGVDVFLFTSEEEGLGTSLLDALACKVPVVATRAGGAPEVILHQKTGLVAAVKDASTLAQQVLQLLEDTTLAQQLITGGLVHLQQFTTTQTAQKTLAIYQKIVAPKL